MTDNALYLEVDEDITSAIDKLAKVQGTSVQIVVPKRSTMLQSMINLKLLKKAAENNGKQLVLVTNDRIATDLASRVGLAVAPSIGAKPVIKETSMPEQLKDSEEVINADDPEPTAMPTEPQQRPVSARPKRLSLKRKELTDAPAAAVSAAADTADQGDTAASVSGAKPAKPIKVPNWNVLQKRAMWIGLAVVLVAGYFVMMYLYAGAKVVVFANAQKTPVAVDFTVDPSQNQSNYASTTLAGKSISVTKNLSGQFTPTGKQDVGTKAPGTITVYNCLDGSTHTLVAGTRFADSNGHIFKSTSDISVPGGQGSFAGCSTPGTATVSVQADQNGSNYNESPGDYTIPGLPSSEQTGTNAITAKGAAMSGGTSNIVTVVQQSDVDAAQASVLAGDKNNITGDLSSQIPKGYVGINSSQSSSASNVTPAPAVDAQATSANLTMQVTYKELVIKQSDYKQLLDTQEASQVGNGSQVYDDGYSQILLTQSGADNSGTQSFHLTTQAYSGPKIDTAAVGKQIAGKKYGDAVDFAKGMAGVTDAQITIWPAWSSNLPTQADKIHVSIKVANQSS